MLVSRERRALLLEEYDRSGMSGIKFAQYVGIKYSTLAYWLQSRRRHRQKEKSLIKAGADTEPGRSNGAWIEAVIENPSGPGVPAGALRIYFAGGTYCQISSAGERPLAPIPPSGSGDFYLPGRQLFSGTFFVWLSRHP